MKAAVLETWREVTRLGASLLVETNARQARQGSDVARCLRQRVRVVAFRCREVASGKCSILGARNCR